MNSSRNWREYMEVNYPFLSDKYGRLAMFLEDSIADEAKAGPDYERMAALATELGDEDTAAVFRSLAVDERRHLAALKELKRRK